MVRNMTSSGHCSPGIDMPLALMGEATKEVPSPDTHTVPNELGLLAEITYPASFSIDLSMITARLRASPQSNNFTLGKLLDTEVKHLNNFMLKRTSPICTCKD